jgi:hypothetical protein
MKRVRKPRRGRPENIDYPTVHEWDGDRISLGHATVFLMIGAGGLPRLVPIKGPPTF